MRAGIGLDCRQPLGCRVGPSRLGADGGRDGGTGRRSAHRAPLLLVREVPVSGRDPRGPRLSVAAARPRRAGQGPRPDRRRPRGGLPAGSAQDRGGRVDRRRRDPRARRTRPVRPLRAGALRRPGPLPDRLRARIRDLRPDRRDALDRPRGAPVDRVQGHPHVRHRGAEGALPPRPRRRSQARRLRADRAQRGLGRLPHRKPGGPASRRLLGSERREALHRQRGQGLGVHDLRPLRGGRQGSPHRADRREADEGLRGRRALRHHGAARATTFGASTSRTCGCRRRTCSASPARASASRWRSSTTGGSAWARARSAPPSGCSTRRSSTSTIAASSAIRWPTSSWSRTRSAGWSPTCSGWSRCAI